MTSSTCTCIWKYQASYICMYNFFYQSLIITSKINSYPIHTEKIIQIEISLQHASFNWNASDCYPGLDIQFESDTSQVCIHISPCSLSQSKDTGKTCNNGLQDHIFLLQNDYIDKFKKRVNANYQFLKMDIITFFLKLLDRR